jgi:hypothetical protein
MEFIVLSWPVSINLKNVLSKKGCEYNEPLACKRYSLFKNLVPDEKIKFNKEAFEKNIKDAFNKMLKGSKNN